MQQLIHGGAARQAVLFLPLYHNKAIFVYIEKRKEKVIIPIKLFFVKMEQRQLCQFHDLL